MAPGYQGLGEDLVTTEWTEADKGAHVRFAQQVRDLTAQGEEILSQGADIRDDFPGLVGELRAALNKLGAR